MVHFPYSIPENSSCPVVRSLAIIASLEPDIRAFAWHLRPDALFPGPHDGPVKGLAFGVKDVIDVAGMPTRCGSVAMDTEPRESDAACVAVLRANGAVPVGKTVTAEFAFTEPGPTRNPHRLTHTPGGSSSGSAASVSAGMVEMALGTQTGGSIIRPAAYCGVVGFKPTFGRVDRAGMHVLCHTLDTIGWFTRTVAQSQAISSILLAEPGEPPPRRAPRVALFDFRCLANSSPRAHGAWLSCIQALRDSGAELVFPELNDEIVTLTHVHGQIMTYELAQSLLPLVTRYGDRISAASRNVVIAGQAIDQYVYGAAQSQREDLAQRWLERFVDVDFIVTPSTPDVAPEGLASTGSSIFNRIWSLLGWPCVQLPMQRAQGELPIGVQWIGRPGADAALLAWAALFHERMKKAPEVH